MTTFCYHTTASGHKVHLTLEGDPGPVLITIHGGGIIRGSRRDAHVPNPIKKAWPGWIIGIDYRLLVPSTGFDILEDMKALFNFLPTLDIPVHELFLIGFSGGGYPMRLAAVLAAEEVLKPNPAFTVLGCISYFGMGGDMLHDYWFTPQSLKISENDLAETQAEWSDKVQRWRSSKEEYSDAPADQIEGRNVIWEYWHMTGTINDSLTGMDGFSATLRKIPRATRSHSIPKELLPLYPQLYMSEHAERMPPLLLVHGDADQAVPYDESLVTLRSFKTRRGKVKMITIEGGNHALKVNDVVPEATTKAYQETVKWMLDLVSNSRTG